jgi:aspartyl/asparaginyl beta-hydroxylase (cupin superfamily)
VLNIHHDNLEIDEYFYNVDQVCPDLHNIIPISQKVLSEAYNVMNGKWYDWPETELYQKPNSGQWKIFPFYAFGIWENENCRMCPIIYDFLKQIPNLKLATLSKLTAGMKLKPHRGWAKHSNNVIRCHYGLIVPEKCYISVEENGIEKIKYHKQFQWLLFDDSKTHYAENKSDTDRVVLIIDVERPNHIKIGTSTVGDSKELLEIVNYFREKNKILNVS